MPNNEQGLWVEFADGTVVGEGYVRDMHILSLTDRGVSSKHLIPLPSVIQPTCTSRLTTDGSPQVDRTSYTFMFRLYVHWPRD